MPGAGDPIQEATIVDVHAAYRTGQLTAERLTEQYLDRITTHDPALNAILTVNEHALERARRLDLEFREDGFVGPLHGIPVLLKDNQDTHDMPTTAGSVALADWMPRRDAFIVEQLRNAGAIVLGKTNLQEFSYGVDTISSLGGATRNAYDRDYRPSGSSGGTATAVAANLAIAGTGSDTCSSVRSPPAFNNLVGVRPTRGLVSRTGIIPLSDHQDTAGPIARTVEDAARLLSVMAGYDPADPVTARGIDHIPDGGFSTAIDPNGLENARIGVAREFFGLQDPDSGRAAEASAVTRVLERAIDAMAAAGASIVDPVTGFNDDDLARARVITYECARDVGRYFASHGSRAPFHALKDVYETGSIHPAVATRLEATGILEIDPATLDEHPAYLGRLALRERIRDRTLARMADDDLDALVYPPSTIPPVALPEQQPFAEMNCELAAHTGLPAIVVPAGFTDAGLPVGIEFLAREFAEAQLFAIAAGFEAVTGHRRPPTDGGPVNE